MFVCRFIYFCFKKVCSSRNARHEASTPQVEACAERVAAASLYGLIGRKTQHERSTHECKYKKMAVVIVNGWPPALAARTTMRMTQVPKVCGQHFGPKRERSRTYRTAVPYRVYPNPRCVRPPLACCCYCLNLKSTFSHITPAGYEPGGMRARALHLRLERACVRRHCGGTAWRYNERVHARQERAAQRDVGSGGR